MRPGEKFSYQNSTKCLHFSLLLLAYFLDVLWHRQRYPLSLRASTPHVRGPLHISHKCIRSIGTRVLLATTLLFHNPHTIATN